MLFHGLEGSSQSHYALAFAQQAAQHGWRFALPHFRGCSGELNRAPRAYHSGDFEEVGWILDLLRAAPGPAAVRRRRVARRQCADALGRGGRRRRRGHRTRGRRDLLAAGPDGGRAGDRPRLQPAGLRAHVPVHDEATRAGQVAAAPGAVRPRPLSPPRAPCTSSTTPSRRRCTALPARPTTGRAPRPSRTCTASASRRWRSTPATTPSCRRRRCRGCGEVGECVTLWQPEHGGHVGFPGGSLPGPCAGHAGGGERVVRDAGLS